MTKTKGGTLCGTKKRTDIYIKEKHIILLCILSLWTAKGNIHLSSLPVLFVLLCDARQSRYICAAAVTVWCGTQIVTGSFYIPYMAFVFVFVIADTILPKGKLLPVYPGVIVFVLVKYYVLTFGYGMEYKLVLALETAAFLLVPQAVQSGSKLLRENGNVSSSLQLAEAASALGILALSVSGIGLWGINLPLCLTMSLCFFYGTKDNMPLAMLCMLVSIGTVWHSRNLPYMFAGILLIGFAAFALLQKGYAGYFATFAVALATTMIFITKFNSVIFVTTASVALTVCFTLSKIHTSAYKCRFSETAGEGDYLRLMNSVDRLGRAFRFLGSTIIDISGLMTDDTPPKEIQDVAAEQVCRKCKNNHICWQQNFDHTQKQFSSFEDALKKGEEFGFDERFISCCDKTEQLAQSFISAHRLISAKKLINKAGMHNRRILQNQFFSMAQTLQDIVYHSGRRGIANTAFTHTVNSFLLGMGKRVNYCICFQNRGKCIISTAEYFSTGELERIKQKLESVYGITFDMPTKEDDGEGLLLYTFSERVVYDVEYASCSKGKYRVCGDICEEFAAEEYRYIILADGMGTGSFAAAESRTAVCMLKSLLTAAVSPETAIDIVNTAMNLKGTGQSCVALDILQINCYNGRCKIYKAGAAASVVIIKGKASIIYRESIPVGILKDTKVAVSDFVLENGDTVLVLSDGMDAGKELICKVQMMYNKLSAEELVQMLTDNIKNTDDATAAAVKLVRT